MTSSRISTNSSLTAADMSENTSTQQADIKVNHNSSRPNSIIGAPGTANKIANSPSDNEPSVETGKKDDESEKEDVDPDHVYPSSKALIPIIIALYLAVFLVALDRTIIATIIPLITDEFNSLADVGWYGSVYLLTGCGLLPLSSKIYTFYSPKWVFISQIVIFEAGSALCGWAPNSKAFIAGRAIAGAGTCGIFSGAIVLLTDSVPLHKRPMYIGSMGALFALSSVVGPLMGGAFAESATWRWSFWINLPIGAVTTVIIIFILVSPKATQKDLTLKQRINQLDPIGTVLFFGGITCLILALQWGGTEYAWSEGRVVALLVLFSVSMVAFIAVQIWKQEDATIPPRIFMQRTVISCTWFSFTMGGSFYIIVYYLPIWFQGVKGTTAIQSGIRVLPLILAMSVGTIGAGIFVRKFGYYVPFMIAGSIGLSIGAGVISLLEVHSPAKEWIGYQVVYGLGLGLGMQQASIGTQTVLSRKDTPIGVTLVMFSQIFGGTIFLAVAQNLFAKDLVQGIGRANIPNVDPVSILRIGATDLRNAYPVSYLPEILGIYNEGIIKVFYVSIGLACASIFGALGTEWVSVRKDVKKDGKKGDKEGKEEKKDEKEKEEDKTKKEEEKIAEVA